jgi:rare lipoprotein A
MKSISFRTAQNCVPVRVKRFAAGVVVLGLALSASAKDGSPSVNSRAANTKAEGEGDNKSVVNRSATKAGAGAGAKSRTKRRFPIEIGVASWYGGKFQGRTTAAGEHYDMNTMTCAHPTLPMGTWLRVTNLHNRRTAYVRVNDRGPVVDGRIVDLSRAAAQVLGFEGLAKVKLETISIDDPAIAETMVAQVHMPQPFWPMVQ